MDIMLKIGVTEKVTAAFHNALMEKGVGPVRKAGAFVHRGGKP